MGKKKEEETFYGEEGIFAPKERRDRGGARVFLGDNGKTRKIAGHFVYAREHP